MYAGHVLIIEDEPSMTLLLESFMVKLGFETFEHCSCEMASVSMARLRRPDLVVADVNLDPGSGLAASAVIASAFAVPRIIVTGRPAEAVGVDRALVVQKPFSLETLSAAIARAMRR